MPDSDNLVTGIIFSTNANSVADEVHNLDKAINAVERTQDRIDQKENKKKKEKIRTPQEVFRIYSKMLQRYTKQQQKADKEKIKDTKSLVNLEKQRFNLAKGLVRYAAGAISVGAVINYVAETMKKGRQYAIASNATGQNAQTIESIGYMGKKYGGDMSTATNDILGLNQGIKAIEMGLNPYEELARLFPNAYNDIFFDKNRRVRTDPVAILQKISELMQGMDARTVQAFGNALGLSESMILLLKSSDGKFSEILAENIKNSSINQEQSKKLDESLSKYDTIARSIEKGFVNIAASMAKYLPNDKKTQQKLGENIAKTTTVAIGASATKLILGLVAPKVAAFVPHIGVGIGGFLLGYDMSNAWIVPKIKESYKRDAQEKYGKPISDNENIYNQTSNMSYLGYVADPLSFTTTPFNHRGAIDSALSSEATQLNTVNNNGDIVINTTSDNPQEIARELQRVMQTYDYFNNLNGSNPFKNLLIQSSGNVKN